MSEAYFAGVYLPPFVTSALGYAPQWDASRGPWGCRVEPSAVSGLPTPTPVELPRGFEIHSDFYVLNSPKNGRQMKFFSGLEYHHALLLEATPEALQYCEQPIKVELRGKWYVFDCWIRWSDGRQELREVKPTEKLVLNATGARVPARWDEIVSWCNTQGYQSSFVTEKTLKPHEHLIRNWQRLLPYVLEAQERPRPDLEKSLTVAVGDTPQITLGQLTSLLAAERPASVTVAAANLLHKGRLLANLDHQRLGPMLEFTLNLGHVAA